MQIGGNRPYRPLYGRLSVSLNSAENAHFSGKCLSCPATKNAKNVDEEGENGASATKMAENVDEAAKSWTALALQPLHEAVYAGAGEGEVRGRYNAGLGTYAKAAAHEFGDAVDGFFGNYAAA